MLPKCLRFHKPLEWGKKTETKNHYNPSYVYYQIAKIYTKMDQWKLALENYKKALNWKMQIGDIDGAKSIFLEISKKFFNKNDIMETINFNQEHFRCKLNKSL